MPPKLLTFGKLYIGTATDMDALPVPNGGVDMPMSRGGGSSETIDGGQSTYNWLKVRRSFSYGWDNQNPDDAAIVLSYWDGLRGPGPFMLVDPAWRNLMDLDVCTFGKRLGAITGWSTPASAPNPTTSAQASPGPPTSSAVGPYSGVGQVIAATAPCCTIEGVFGTGAAFTANVDSVSAVGTAVPRLAGEFQTLGMFVQSASNGGAARLCAFGSDINGAGTITTNKISGTLVTGMSAGAWQLLTVTVKPTDLPTSGYVSLGLDTTVTGTYRFAQAMHQPGVAVLDPWVQGYAVPRVTFPTAADVSSALWAVRSTRLVVAEL